MAKRISRKKSANFISDPSSVNVRLPLANKTFHIRHFRYGSPTTAQKLSPSSGVRTKKKRLKKKNKQPICQLRVLSSHRVVTE